MVLKGELTSKWIEDGKELVKRVGEAVHTFENETDELVEFIVFRFVPDGTDKRELIKMDKAVVERN